MSVNFYNTSGSMFGFDLHKYVWLGCPPKGELPVPHYVGLMFVWPAYIPPSKRENRVTMDGWSSLKKGIDFCLVPHIPIPVLPPDPREVGQLASVIMGSSSKAWMSVHKVRISGDPAASCLFEWLGTNQNCDDVCDNIKNNLVLNFNSVKTEPTLGDYLGSALGAIVDIAMGMAVGSQADKSDRFGNGIKWLWRVAPHVVPSDTAPRPVLDFPDTVNNKVIEWVDGEPAVPPK